MKKRRRFHQKAVQRGESIAWLPIDNRLFTPFISFGHVQGFTRWFLIIEMILALGIVSGTILLFIVSKLF